MTNMRSIVRLVAMVGGCLSSLVALLGTPPRPLTWKVRGEPALNLPDRPLPKRESSTRAGASGT